MRTLSLWKSILLFAILILGATACNDDDDGTDPVVIDPQNIVEIAQGSEALSILVEALTTADENEDIDLIGTLSGAGPFTVFAPTDDAFTELLGSLDGYDSLEDFDTAEEQALLASILSYHVVSGAAVLSTDLTDGQEVTTVQGENVTISLDGGVFVQDATDEVAEVVQADVAASNGVVHVIDKVLLPQAALDAIAALNEDNGDEEESADGGGTIIEAANDVEGLDTLIQAIGQSGIDAEEAFDSEAPFTVFAPTDEAFEELLDLLGDDYQTLEDFDTDEDKTLLVAVLTYHMVAGSAVRSTDLVDGQMIDTEQGESVSIVFNEGAVEIDDATEDNATVTDADLEAGNGVIHVIDKVLLPQEVLDILNPSAEQ